MLLDREVVEYQFQRQFLFGWLQNFQEALLEGVSWFGKFEVSWDLGLGNWSSKFSWYYSKWYYSK